MHLFATVYKKWKRKKALVMMDYRFEPYYDSFPFPFSFAEPAENPWGQSSKKDSPTKQAPQKATEEDLYY